MEFKMKLWLFTLCGIVSLCDSRKRKTFDENVSHPPFDQALYEEVLNSELCERQINYLTNNDTILLARFLDAGVRIPKGILIGNNMDLGNYHQCLGIQENVGDMNFQGKYCMIHATFNQEIKESQYDFLEWSNIDLHHFHVIQNIVSNATFKRKYTSLNSMYGPDSQILERDNWSSSISSLQYSLALCIPASCTTEESINALPFQVSETGLNFEERFCRLPNDKPWAPVDYVALVIFSIIGILTCLSTSYDLYYTKILKRDSSKRGNNSLYLCCSVYTNTRRLLTFTSGPDSLECIDGIRSLAMVWVILGHSFYSLPFSKNPIETFQWSISPNALWMTTGHITVDTFFMLSGLLIVYTTAGKLTGKKLLLSLHKFYLNRLLRMFPVLAAVTLFEASFYNRISDGPFWSGPAMNVSRCRQYWWSILLHIQNFVNPLNLCLGVTWYLSIDVQLHILSPIVLFWVLSTRRYAAWGALIIALLSVLTASTIYIFLNNFPSGIISPNRADDMGDYFVYYYVNSLTRASPFFVGMIFGYLLHLWRGTEIKITKALVTLYWCGTGLILGSLIYFMYINIQLDWDNQIADNLINSFMRSLWAVSLGWIIFACVKGYGGPINWFLSLQMWKLPARLSYAMYIIHFSLMLAYYNSAVEPMYFTVASVMFNFFAFLSIVVILAIVVTVVIDAPFSTLFKVMLGTGSKQPTKVVDKEIRPETIVPLDIKTGLPISAFDTEQNKLTNVRF